MRIRLITLVAIAPVLSAWQLTATLTKGTGRNAVLVRAAAIDVAEQKAALFSAVGTETARPREREVNECILQLSAANPTSVPARSSLLNGKWEICYAGAPAPGLFDSPTRPLALALYAAPLSPSVLAQGFSKLGGAATLGAQVVTIVSEEAGQPRVSAETSVAVFGGQPNTVALRANLSPCSDVALRETFVEAEALGQRSLLPGPLAISRTLSVVFLDEDLLIVRDEGGLPNVLRRADRFPDANSPSYGDEDDAPGAG